MVLNQRKDRLPRNHFGLSLCRYPVPLVELSFASEVPGVRPEMVYSHFDEEGLQPGIEMDSDLV